MFSLDIQSLMENWLAWLRANHQFAVIAIFWLGFAESIVLIVDNAQHEYRTEEIKSCVFSDAGTQQPAAPGGETKPRAPPAERERAMTAAQWEALARATGNPQWLDDERFETPALRDRHADERLELIQGALRLRTAAEWLDVLDAAGVPCAPVLKRKEMIDHPQVRATGIVQQVTHPRAGELRQARNAARFEGTPTEMRRGAPGLGEHTREILAELGFSDEEIAELADTNVIGIE